MADKKSQRIFRLTVTLLTCLVGACSTTHKPGARSPDGEPGSWTSARPPVSVPVDEGRLHSAEEAYDDVWERIRSGFRLPKLDSPLTDHYVRWYSERPEYLDRMVERASKYLYYIVEQLERNDFPMEIALLPAVESAFRPTAYSHAHASGLWQFISATGRRYGLKQNWWYDGRRDIVGATEAAVKYLSFLRDEFDGDWFHALAAYNTGERRVHQAIDRNRRRGEPTDYEHLDLRRETMRYVPKLMAIKRIVAKPERYGITLKSIPNEPYFEIVETGSQIDLSIAARAAGISTSQLHDLNPGFRRWATDPTGPHRILVPVEAKERVESKLASLPEHERMRWASYTVRRGDTLGEISRRYGVSVSALQTSNKLSGTLIRAGQTLVVPLSGRSIAASASGTAGGARGTAQWASYRVRRGDTLSQIARRHGVSIGMLKTRNSLGGSLIRAGQTLHVPSSASSSADASGETVVHQVRRGDTLWGIARRYQVNVKQLQNWNKLAAQDVLQLGQKIMVYLN